MPIVMNHSAPFGAYGGAMANAAQQDRRIELLNPYMQQYFTQQYQSGESALDRAMREKLQAQQQSWQSSESAAERALREKLQAEQLEKQYPTTYTWRLNSQPFTGHDDFARMVYQKQFG